MNRRYLLILITGLLAGLPLTAGALPASLAGFDLGWRVIASEGTSAGGRYTLPAGIGQPEVAALAGGSYTLRAGFWQNNAPMTACALVLMVNTTDDTDDGTCDAIHCSLREAIQAANANPGPDTVAFNIPPSDPGYNPDGWWTIRPTSELPDLTDDGTTIDGTTQAANRGDTNPLGPEIELDGNLVGGNGRGFYIRSANNVIRGLAINRFTETGIRLEGHAATNNRIVGNYLGTDPTGTQDRGNGWGIYIYLGAHDATATDAAGNTSEFSAPMAAWRNRVYLPLVWR